MSAQRSDQKGTYFSPHSALRPAERRSLAFGIERIGLVSLHYPRIVSVILILLCVVAGLGIERIKIDDSLSQLFRSNSSEFKEYEEVVRRFPSDRKSVV